MQSVKAKYQTQIKREDFYSQESEQLPDALEQECCSSSIELQFAVYQRIQYQKLGCVFKPLLKHLSL